MKASVRYIEIAIVGGGAAGFFAAIRIKEYHANAQVAILEKTSKALSKVLISGGGRCNVTHNPAVPLTQYARCYPRGEKLMKKILRQFSAQDTFEWFSQQGVRLKVEADGRVFPVNDSSSTILIAYLSAAQNTTSLFISKPESIKLSLTSMDSCLRHRKVKYQSKNW